MELMGEVTTVSGTRECTWLPKLSSSSGGDPLRDARTTGPRTLGSDSEEREGEHERGRDDRVGDENPPLGNRPAQRRTVVDEPDTVQGAAESLLQVSSGENADGDDCYCDEEYLNC